MLVAINAWSFPQTLSVDEQLAAAAKSGFAGIELTCNSDGPIRFDSSPAECAEIGAHGAALGVAIVGLTTAAFWQTNFASPTSTDRERARDVALRMLDVAVSLGAGAIVIVPAVVGKAAEPAPQVAYGDALNRTYEALAALRFEAEARGVVIAIETVWNRFLLSPIEACDLLDRINSPCVRVCLDTGNVMAHGYPQDWIRTLGGRLARVHAKDYDLSKPGRAGFCPLGEGSVDWPAVMSALRDARYDGPMIYEGGGDLAEASRRLNTLVSYNWRRPE